ncbi:MAG: hypothetical protein HQK81_00645 [Desulfovibrionaceae bacterium]|nr:hypothetical protein [Desulfovibrionaceae bacterium]MBF0512555.1 hypothetical protein [Desulfovibrionaceae bacterium]
MTRTVCALFLALLTTCPCAPANAASQSVRELRAKDGLAEFTAPQTFLEGNFVADEVEPRYVFGAVKDFAASRSCPVAWLIEAAEKTRIDAANGAAGSLEYSLILEEDCPGKVIHYVFIDRSRADTAQWLDWRRQFHKNKTDGQYTQAKDSLEKAGQSGFPVSSELRFIDAGGDLQLQKPEDFLIREKKMVPLYDLSQGKALAK